MRIADLAGNTKALKVAQDEAKALLEDDPQLKKSAHTELVERIRLLFREDEFGDIFN